MKECPFCGNSVDLKQHVEDAYIGCIQCDAIMMESEMSDTPATEAWEKRLGKDTESCPFCGSAGENSYVGEKAYSVECASRDCGAWGPIAESKEEAMAAWRKRHKTRNEEVL